MAHPSEFASFLETLNTRGVEAALAFLNAKVAHRYTAAYRVDGGMLRNVALHDKEGEVRPEFLAVVPFESSFCQFVLRDGSFRTDNSGTDARLDGHPYQGVMVCYHGVPLVDDAGELLGTLCHFDVVEHGLPEADFELL
jgi:hypothetical protein